MVAGGLSARVREGTRGGGKEESAHTFPYKHKSYLLEEEDVELS